MFGLPYNYFQKDKKMTKKMTKPISASLEDYLECIYNIIQEKNGVKAIEISRRLGVGRSSVTEALKILAEKELINYGRYDVISLTKEGSKVALGVIFKHQTLKDFLIKVLCLSEENADIEACKVEHVLCEETIQHFISFIKYHEETANQDGNHPERYLAFHKKFLKR